MTSYPGANLSGPGGDQDRREPGLGPERPLCIDCLAPATVQVITPDGIPVGLCDADWQHYREFGEAVLRMFENAFRDLANSDNQLPFRDSHLPLDLPPL